jgi:hypothetical protein
MVTEYMEKSEPLRNEIRKLSVKLLLESQKTKASLEKKEGDPSRVKSIISLLDIAASIGLISAMNHSILAKELSGLDEVLPRTEVMIENILKDVHPKSLPVLEKFDIPKGQKDIVIKDTKVLYEEMPEIEIKEKPVVKEARKEAKRSLVSVSSKLDRREAVFNFIKDRNGVTIKDIIESMSEYGEKTLQREILGLVREGLVIKVGEKRWSRYFPSESLGM